MLVHLPSDTLHSPVHPPQKSAPRALRRTSHTLSRGGGQAGVTRAASSSVEAAPAVEGLSGPASEAVAQLKAAAFQTKRPAGEVCSALLTLDKAKLQPDQFLDYLGGHDKAGGKTWKLVFTSDAKQTKEAGKGGKGGGIYFPITACQNWDAQTLELENGIYLGQLAALTFRGPFKFQGRKLDFDYKTLRLRLGPKWFDFGLKPGQLGTKKSDEDKQGPFFLFAYVDDDIAVARGRGGGLAFWARAPQDFLVSAGVVL